MGLFGKIFGLWFGAAVAHSSGSIPVQHVVPTVEVIESSEQMQDHTTLSSQQSNSDHPLPGTQSSDARTVALAGE